MTAPEEVHRYGRHAEHSAPINGSADQVFDHLDDPTRLTEHMSTRSWKLGWGRMETVLDGQGGRAIGSHIVVRGRAFGLRLALEEVVTSRLPPLTKTWETVGEPRLLVIGPYRMGFTLTPAGAGVDLLVAIDYGLPPKGIPWLLGRLLGRLYATWCTRRMVRDAQHAFGPSPAAAYPLNEGAIK